MLNLPASEQPGDAQSVLAHCHSILSPTGPVHRGIAVGCFYVSLTESALQILTRPFYYAIIDEVDSILIDDCRNPLRITSAARMPLWRFRIAAQVLRSSQG